MSTSQYPTSIDAFATPQAQQATNQNSHALMHVEAFDAIAAVQTLVGITGSADTNSVIYKLAHPAASGGYPANYFPQAAVITNIDRAVATQANGTSGIAQALTLFSGFIAPASLPINNVTVYVQQAGTGITSSQAALYTVASNGDLTRVAVSNANTTWLGTTGKRTIAFAAPVTTVAGNAYVVSIGGNVTGTQCNIAGCPALGNNIMYSGILQPFHLMFSSSAASGATVTFASLSAGGGTGVPYVELS